MMGLIVQLLCPFGYDNTFSSSIGIPLLLGSGMFVSLGVSFFVRGTRKAGKEKISQISNLLLAVQDDMFLC